VLLPWLLAALANRAALCARFGRARIYATLVALLHPFDGWPLNQRILAAQAMAQRGERDRAVARIAVLLANGRLAPAARTILEAQRCRIAGRWEELAALGDASGLSDDPNLLSLRLRALGETGRLRELVRAFRLGRPGIGVAALMSQLALLAF